MVSAENLIVEVGNQRTTKPSTTSKDTKKAVIGLSGAGLGLDDLIRQGAQQVIQQAIEAEPAEQRWPRSFGQSSEIFKWNVRGNHAADLIAGSVAKYASSGV